MALTTPTPPNPSPRTLRAMQRRFARAHAPRDNRAADIVLAALGAYVVTGIAWWLTTRPAPALVDPAHQPGAWNPTWAWAVAAAAVAAGATAARAVGPLTTSPERGFWLLPTPVDRAAMLRSPLLVTSVVAAVAGAAVGRSVAFAGAAANWAPLTVGGAAAGVAVAATAVLTQSRIVPAWTIRGVQILFTAVALGLAVAGAAGPAIPVAATWTPVTGVTVIAVAMAAATLRACGRITAADLDAGADIGVATRVSVVGMDMSVLTGVVEDRAWRRVASRPTRRLPCGRARALIRADALRHRRRPSAFAATAGAVAGAWAIGAAVSPIAAAWTQLATTFVVAVVFGAGLRELSADPELEGMLGTDNRSLRRPLMAVPTCAAAAVTVMTAPLVGWSIPALVVVLIGACGAAYRLRTRPRIAYDGLVLATGVGQIPLDWIRQMARGPDALIVSAILLAIVC